MNGAIIAKEIGGDNILLLASGVYSELEKSIKVYKTLSNRYEVKLIETDVDVREISKNQNSINEAFSKYFN